MTQPHAALLCRDDYSHSTPHCGRTRTLLTAVCLWQGASAATADGENYMHGRRPASSACTVAEDAAGDWLLPACVARASQAAWIAPVEPSAGERVGGKGAVQHGADWRAVSVHELDCVRCARSGGVHRGSGGLLRWQLPQGDPSSTHT